MFSLNIKVQLVFFCNLGMEEEKLERDLKVSAKRVVKLNFEIMFFLRTLCTVLLLSPQVDYFLPYCSELSETTDHSNMRFRRCNFMQKTTSIFNRSSKKVRSEVTVQHWLVEIQMAFKELPVHGCSAFKLSVVINLHSPKLTDSLAIPSVSCPSHSGTPLMSRDCVLVSTSRVRAKTTLNDVLFLQTLGFYSLIHWLFVSPDFSSHQTFCLIWLFLSMWFVSQQPAVKSVMQKPSSQMDTQTHGHGHFSFHYNLHKIQILKTAVISWHRVASHVSLQMETASSCHVQSRREDVPSFLFCCK